MKKKKNNKVFIFIYKFYSACVRTVSELCQTISEKCTKNVRRTNNNRTLYKLMRPDNVQAMSEK